MEVEARYHPSPDQLALAAAMSDPLSELLPLSRLHLSSEETAETWAVLEDLGIFGMAVGQDRGGSGLGAVEEALIVTALGRQLVAPAVLATIGATHARWRGEPSKQDRARRVSAAYRRQARVVVIEDSQTDLMLVRSPSEGIIFETPSLTGAIDDRLWAVRMRDAGSPGAALGSCDREALLRLRLLDAAALSGLAETALSLAVAYAGLREQFGRPIGSFQAVKHHCANMAVAARCARDQTRFAAVALDDKRGDAALHVDCALLIAGFAALENAGKNIQIHGAIGFSDEADAHLLLKRAQLLLALAGGLEAANARIANTEATGRSEAG
jgi:alkylation response protein AidB-like acyl-CoA dehydrogenase